MLEGVKHVVLVLSGKGGVGKSTVSTQLALTLKEAGFKVGLLDVDLCGPSIPYLLNLEGKDVHQSTKGWVPVYADEEQKLAVMSIGFLLKNRNDGVVWRGPKKTGMIKQFLTDVVWEDIDYLIIDTPPGTSDEHITVMENLRSVKCDGAVIVTTPQAVAVDDVLREVTFCRKTGIPIIGIVENMSGFVCPTCSECTNIFSSGGGQALAEMVKVPFLGRIPIDPAVGKLADKGQSILVTLPDSELARIFRRLIEQITRSKEA
ncbi:cytosolic Fe-S cluster assembly factor Nubp2 homolog [Neodiprion pinetum]|uniref:Cytosolic Fe-S cluster assembly factor NUBP2 homolog n=1 Tax=Neodiprion lecontei TaxID=441921 RepID=A0A6J0CFE1_NEOLC|nr:cytosolic Fe-S cluster assembly factor NUBP2 homolog [Neodiprion lecontei]XP_046412751.1 cytosolic Fe-S cluster assembly factor NUBP2 homolog [Neodiprion fabricii]XP_046468012.1 cytosolic Fe-S cluster assembly factor NUBP2 homolog [Neodiprion pinetum]XP_046606217.1 cytosolic Fe-S cluster assembly factor NUBP2 homolog [Neodiprion virginianus]